MPRSGFIRVEQRHFNKCRKQDFVSITFGSHGFIAAGSKTFVAALKLEVALSWILNGGTLFAFRQCVGVVNGDGLPDIAVGFEEAGITKLFFHPVRTEVKAIWLSASLAPTISVEDASIVDVDGDGNPDVLALTEGDDKSLLVFFGPALGEQSMPAAWSRVKMNAAADMPSMRFMFAAAADLNGDGSLEIIVGGKDGAALGYLISTNANRRDPTSWRFFKLRDIGWTMSLVPIDMDRDGDMDLVFSDRMRWDRARDLRGVYWLEHPGFAAINADPGDEWVQHTVGMTGEEVMFIDVGDIDRDGFLDVVVANKSSVEPAIFFGQDSRGRTFLKVTPSIAGLAAAFGTGKVVTIADLDGDGRLDIVYSAEHAEGKKSGIVILSFGKSPRNAADWRFSDIGGSGGIKFDLVPVLDVDGDGDLDIVTTEEEEEATGGLGVGWYENPLN